MPLQPYEFDDYADERVPWLWLIIIAAVLFTAAWRLA